MTLRNISSLIRFYNPRVKPNYYVAEIQILVLCAFGFIVGSCCTILYKGAL